LKYETQSRISKLMIQMDVWAVTLYSTPCSSTILILIFTPNCLSCFADCVCLHLYFGGFRLITFVSGVEFKLRQSRQAGKVQCSAGQLRLCVCALRLLFDARLGFIASDSHCEYERAIKRRHYGALCCLLF